MSETELALLIIAIMAGFSDHKDWRFDTTGLRTAGIQHLNGVSPGQAYSLAQTHLALHCLTEIRYNRAVVQNAINLVIPKSSFR